MKKAVLRMLLCLQMLALFLPVTAQADIGPKPAVHITFRHAPDTVYFATLLSSEPTNGPDTVYDGSNPWNHEEYPQIWRAFVDYEDTADGFYFLQNFWKCGSGSEDAFSWTYRAPNTFKILCYFPDTDTFAISDTHVRYAFDTYYDVELSGWQSGEILPADREYAFAKESAFLVVRVVLTILVELGVAVLFGCDSKAFRKVIVPTNITTQLFLNIMLNYNTYRALILHRWVSTPNQGLLFFMLEGVVFLIEAGIYAFRFPSVSDKKEVRPVSYAFWANLCSYGVGYALAAALPALF
ncbi:MAG: hypothetical protein IJF79_05430 [Clostridia bacterium]|nr:hypothetical protein [Clostridia bacterium]